MAGNRSPSAVKCIALNDLFCCIWMTKKLLLIQLIGEESIDSSVKRPVYKI